MIIAAAFGAIRYIAAAVGTAFILVACDSASSSRTDKPLDLQRWVNKIRVQSSEAMDPVPPMRQFEPFQYKSDGVRDPFSMAWSGRGASGMRPDSKRRKQMLEQYPLERLKMMGTIGTSLSRVGLVMAPDMVTYRVFPGVYMGRNEGRVKRVYEDRIELAELAPDGTGGWSERAVALTLDQ